MMGATGAVGNQVVKFLLASQKVDQLTLLGRKPLVAMPRQLVHQHEIDIHEPTSYENQLLNHQVGICTLGVGQPSKLSKEEFTKIDKTAVFNFASACRDAGIQHFQLLSSVGINESSSSFYLRTKAELVSDITELGFKRFSVFQPSMILTPKNRYGAMQGVILKIWPLLSPILQGGLKKYRGIKVEDLGRAMACNTFNYKTGKEMLTWSDFFDIIQEKQSEIE